MQMCLQMLQEELCWSSEATSVQDKIVADEFMVWLQNIQGKE